MVERDTAWRNWAGNQRAVPARTVAPRSTAEVAEAVRDAARDGLTARMTGTGHSFTGAAATDGVRLLPDRLTAIRSVDAEAGLVTVEAGLPLAALNTALAARGLALANMGDVTVQTIAGALVTGTHGTGRDSASIAGQVHGLELVLADGTVTTCSADAPDGSAEHELFEAARVSIGALGVITAVTFRVEPAFLLRAREAPMRLAEVLDRFDELADGNEHFEFYWFPHTEATSTKRNNRTDAPAAPLGRWRYLLDDELLSNTVFEATNRLGAALPATIPTINAVAARALGTRAYTDAAHRVFASPRRVRFLEQEYAIGRADLVPALREIKALIAARDWRISFPLEVRVSPPDTSWLASSHGRPTAYIACHVYHRTPNDRYFRAVEEILTAVGGRPHWGKLHTRTAGDLRAVYPRFDAFTALRDRLDPARTLANPYLTTILGP